MQVEYLEREGAIGVIFGSPTLSIWRLQASDVGTRIPVLMISNVSFVRLRYITPFAAMYLSLFYSIENHQGSFEFLFREHVRRIW